LAVAANTPPLVKTQIANQTLFAGVTTKIDLLNAFDDPDTNAVRFSTVQGIFDVQLFTGQKPITVANFLRYVDQGRYFKIDPTTHHRASNFIHRSIANFVIQGGGFLATVNTGDPTRATPTKIAAFPRITNEPGISNMRGTIAMAKLPNDANSATSEWFINLQNNGGPPNNLDTTNGGFTVFGKVRGSGMTTVDRIATIPRIDVGAPFDDLPVINYMNPNPIRVANLVSIPDIIRIPPFTFLAFSYNTAVATVSIDAGRRLTINAKGIGTATILLRATDYDGASVTQIFTVNVVASPGRLINIAARANVLADPNELIAGFVITGTPPKRLLLRGVGPSLAQHQVQNSLGDPTLELRKVDNTFLVANNDWGDGSTRQQIMDTDLAPKSTSEAAIPITLAGNTPGYTAIMRGVNTTGIGLAEVYDLDNGPGSRLVNLSARSLVQTGDNVMIGGFVIAGSTPTKVLIRGIGPSLAAFMVPNTLPDPKLELHNPQGVKIAENNDWQTASNAADIQSSGFAPTNSRESAILTMQTAGGYTAILSGLGSKPTGIGSVEIYQLP
jgi:cyclophilin family peptidyl-prolyl cis-trans isomerase